MSPPSPYSHLLQSNVLVDSDGVAKLCDFGLVRLADWEGPAGMTTTSAYTGTERYKAPELFISPDNRCPVATIEGDIYSLRCIMLEVLSRGSMIYYTNTTNSLSSNSIPFNDSENRTTSGVLLWMDVLLRYGQKVITL